MNYYIEAIDYYLPDHIIDNEYLEKECGIDREFTENKVGIRERRIAAPEETTSSMAVNAARILIEKNNINTEDIGMILLCTQNPDYRLPTTACIVQDKVGLDKSTMAFDINLGCSAFTYALPIAGNFIKNGTIKKALIITSEQYSKVTNFKDHSTAAIFGDAAASTLLSSCPDGYGVMDSNFGTDGSGAEKLIVPNSGVAKDSSQSNYLFMDGREIFKFSMFTVPPSIKELLKRNNFEHKDIRYFILHQANKYMLGELQKRMKLTDEQMIIDMELIGNTVSSTIPIALKNLMAKNVLKRNDLMLFSGFGVGLSWANALYKVY
jgi:3-oxoacyl-[acyl-carrier-protein] synthase-3